MIENLLLDLDSRKGTHHQGQKLSENQMPSQRRDTQALTPIALKRQAREYSLKNKRTNFLGSQVMDSSWIGT